MDFDSSDLVGFLDRAGIVAFAFSGVEIGVRRRLDIFGLLVMGIVTSTGGGAMRDVVIGRVPLVFERPVTLYVHTSAKIGAVTGATAKSFSTDTAPAE